MKIGLHVYCLFTILIHLIKIYQSETLMQKFRNLYYHSTVQNTYQVYYMQYSRSTFMIKMGNLNPDGLRLIIQLTCNNLNKAVIKLCDTFSAV